MYGAKRGRQIFSKHKGEDYHNDFNSLLFGFSMKKFRNWYIKPVTDLLPYSVNLNLHRTANRAQNQFLRSLSPKAVLSRRWTWERSGLAEKIRSGGLEKEILRSQNPTCQRRAMVTISTSQVAANFSTRFLQNRHYGMGKEPTPKPLHGEASSLPN